ncbi:hypothetical protein HMPREF9086_2496 [Enterobacter hormaechei ATCC 49162]|nr:hypothetical protein HMPREF9086_2496 [Enterobacter hormaechei ATCC 49162]
MHLSKSASNMHLINNNRFALPGVVTQGTQLLLSLVFKWL